jgi:hypothetical protein
MQVPSLPLSRNNATWGLARASRYHSFTSSPVHQACCSRAMRNSTNECDFTKLPHSRLMGSGTGYLARSAARLTNGVRVFFVRVARTRVNMTFFRLNRRQKRAATWKPKGLVTPALAITLRFITVSAMARSLSGRGARG